MMLSDMNRIKGLTVVIIVSVSSIIALMVMVAAVMHPYTTDESTPSILENWGGIILGFYFGTFVSLLKEWLVGHSENEPSSDSDTTERATSDPQT